MPTASVVQLHPFVNRCNEFRHRRDDYPSEWAAITTCPSGWGLNAETLRNWIRQQQVDDGKGDGVSTEAAAAIRALQRRNVELEQTIEILKAATSFFVRESDPHTRR